RLMPDAALHKEMAVGPPPRGHPAERGPNGLPIPRKSQDQSYAPQKQQQQKQQHQIPRKSVDSAVHTQPPRQSVEFAHKAMPQTLQQTQGRHTPWPSADDYGSAPVATGSRQQQQPHSRGALPPQKQQRYYQRQPTSQSQHHQQPRQGLGVVGPEGRPVRRQFRGSMYGEEDEGSPQLGQVESPHSGQTGYSYEEDENEKPQKKGWGSWGKGARVQGAGKRPGWMSWK
ncbi:hypothetical protein LTS18_010109, partial [Coniosporium uncinatum]